MGVMWSDLETLIVSLAAVFWTLRSIQKVLWYIREQAFTAVQSGMYEDRNDYFCVVDSSDTEILN